MRVIIEDENSISVNNLPENINGNYWLVDENSKNLLYVEAINNKWVIKSNPDLRIYEKMLEESEYNSITSNYIKELCLEEYKHFYILDYKENNFYAMYILPSYEKMENIVVDFNKYNKISFGKGNENDFIINNDLLGDVQFNIEYIDRVLKIKNLDSNIKMFVNNNCSVESVLSNGDVIFIGGIYIYIFGTLLLISNNRGNVTYDNLKFPRRMIEDNPKKDYSKYEDKYVQVFDKKSYFERPPRFKRKIETKTFNIDAPTQKQNQEEMPLIFTIAPMLTMGMMSLVTGITALQRVLDGKSTIKDEFSSLLMCGCMMLSMIVFPLIQKLYTKIKKKKKEKKRRIKYKKYIDTKREEIFKEINYQKQVLIEDNLPLEKVKNIILSKSRNLWERKLEHEDFLEFRLGIGTKKPDIDIKYPEEHFTLEEDDLKDIITDLVNESKDIENVPITLNFKENNKIGIIGDDDLLYSFFDNLLLQVMAYHGYDMLRIIVLTNNKNKNYWDKFRNMPYLWNNDKSLRYYATDKENINKITSYLMEEYNYRMEMSDGKEVNFIPYYLILTDDISSVKDNILIKEILENYNLGYTLVAGVNKLDKLPNECSMFINLAKDVSGLFTNQMTDTNQVEFKADYVRFNLKSIINSISNIPMDINAGKFVLPRKYGFLEMYDVGNVNQLNILNRWKNNDIINSLSCPVGIDEQGELFNIDLHEKAHGPHGLVAGTTGSGKSEWIITYILSMAVNYSPEEVQFVLIDYKGGGLALTFDNRETGVKLPHVVGTLTNLDVVEMKRSLASIASELKRRQSKFKSAREKLNESSMDIYKYQELYRAGKLDEPMSHLFIISDEFAELKAQQPEFMDELISTARIGRSLGIHLILATQKPSGVVNDQIWSNSKFKVCLKVQDKSDSNEMIKCPDAAMLKETGRFYLQVGYNEFFAKGQCAYAGMPYYESENKITLVDSSIDFVDDIGAFIRRGDIQKTNTRYSHKGEELPNILNYIINTVKSQNLNIESLWLSSIPSKIYVDNLKKKYNWEKEDFILNPIIGEYDLPSKQTQGLLTLPLSKDGNTIIYGETGSGKENLITTILYSLITNYSVYEVNNYILDFGSGVLNNFGIASHVGDIVHTGEDEKIENLFKFINSEINIRKEKFISYNGNYYDYVKNTGEKIPSIVVYINQFEIFSELYDKYMDKLINLTRDCVKYGIYFILTCIAHNGVRLKLSQNFKNIITLQLKDEYDYRYLLGNTYGIFPSKIFGRGLYKLEKIVEFQTAYACEKETLYEDIKNILLKDYSETDVKAKSIPRLPETIKFNDVNTEEIGINFIPIGIGKESLDVASFNLLDTISYIVSANKFNNLYNFIDNLLYVLNVSKNLKSFIIDLNYIYEENKYNNLSYLNSNYTEIFNKIYEYYNKVYEVFKNNNYRKQTIKDVSYSSIIIIGVDKFLKSLSSEDKTKYEELIKIGKETNKVHFIFIDILNEIKKCEYDAIYKNMVDSSNGLWIGDGFGNQSIIKASKFNSAHSNPIENNFAYLVINGQETLVKLIDNIE